MCSIKSPAKVELKCGKRAYYHGLGASLAIKALMQRTPQNEQQQMAALRITLSDHLWLMKAGRKWIAEARHRLAPPTLADLGVPASFLTGAVCVHGLEGAWNNVGDFGGGMQFLVGTWNRAADASVTHARGLVPRVSSKDEIAAMKPKVQILAAYMIVHVLDGDSWREWPNTARTCGIL